MRRILLVLAIPLVFCPAARADFVYTFTTTDSMPGAGVLSVTISANDAAVATGKLNAGNIASLSLTLKDTDFPFVDVVSTDKADLVGFYLVDANTGAFTDTRPRISHIDATGQLIRSDPFLLNDDQIWSVLHFGVIHVGEGHWSVASVPEPASLVLAVMGAGVFLAGAVRRWRRRMLPPVSNDQS
jgi:hypothetical protein